MQSSGEVSRDLASATYEDEIPDHELVQAAIQDPQAFAALYRRYVSSIYGYVRNRTPTTDQAEDIVAEVFLSALNGLRGFRGGRHTFRAWLFRIAQRRIADHYRSKSRSERLQASLAQDTAPQEEMERQADLVDLAQLLSQLPSQQQDVLLLRYEHGLSFREIGHVLGKREGTVKVAAHRALRSLRSHMQEETES